MKHSLTAETADRFAGIALGHVAKEYPHKLDHVMDGPEDVRGPRDLHPIFFGSFDWHSCVHGYWLLVEDPAAVPGSARGAAGRGAARRDADSGQGRGRARLSRPRLFGRVRAALWLGLAARAPRRGAAARGGVGGQPGAARRRLRRALQGLSAEAHLSDPGRHPFQHRLRDDPRARLGRGERCRAGGADPRPRGPLLRRRTAAARPGSRAATSSSRRL